MTRRRPPRGRRGSDRRKRTYPVTTRYDALEYAELEAAARRAGLTRASYQRVQSLSRPRTRSVRRPPVEKDLLARVLGQLGKTGSNINQIAHAAHLGYALHADLRAALAALEGVVPLLMLALGRDPGAGQAPP